MKDRSGGVGSLALNYTAMLQSLKQYGADTKPDIKINATGYRAHVAPMVN